MDPLSTRLVMCQTPDGLPAAIVRPQSNEPLRAVPFDGPATVHVRVVPPGPVNVTVAEVTPVPASVALNVKLVDSALFVMPVRTFGAKLKPVSVGAGSTVTRAWPIRPLRVAVMMIAPVSATISRPLALIEPRPGLLDAQ